MRRIPVFALGLVALVFSFGPRVAAAEEYASNAAPLYLIISFDDTFVVTNPFESQTIVVNIGTLVGGQDAFDTQFVVNTSLTGITLPDGRRDPTFQELQTNDATLLGSFATSDLSGVHMMTPAPGEIPPEVQRAVFDASNGGDIDALLATNPFPTTEEIADVVAARLPEGYVIPRDQLYFHLFGAVTTLSAGDGTAEGEGEMFPHTPTDEGSFHFSFHFDKDGNFAADVCMRIVIDIHPGSTTNPVNIKSKTGDLPVAILSSAKFDARRADATSLAIGGVAVDHYALEDVDRDGDLDLVGHWSVPALVAAGAITSTTTSLTVDGEFVAGGCFLGTDSVSITKK